MGGEDDDVAGTGTSRCVTGYSYTCACVYVTVHGMPFDCLEIGIGYDLYMSVWWMRRAHHVSSVWRFCLVF